MPINLAHRDLLLETVLKLDSYGFIFISSDWIVERSIFFVVNQMFRYYIHVLDVALLNNQPLYFASKNILFYTLGGMIDVC